MRLSDTWFDHFQTLPSNDDSNKALAALADATLVSEDTSDESIVRHLTEDENIIILFVAPVTKQIKLLHSPSKLGGTRLNPTTTLTALDGFERSAQPIIFDKTSLTQTMSFRTPTPTALRSITSSNDLSSSSASPNSRTVFKHTPFVILPPFLANALINQPLRTPTDIFLLSSQQITQFDEDHTDDDEYTDSAKDHCINILSFLWGAVKTIVPPITFIPGTDDIHTIAWCTSRHHACITPSTTPSSDESESTSQPITTDIVQTLAYSINSQTEIFEKMRQDKQDSKNEKSNRFDNLHDSCKLMILNASSIDGETTPEYPTDHCSEFFSKKNISKALDYLQTSLDHEFNCCVQIESGLVASLHAGHFLREREDSPSNFSFFLTPKKQPLATNRFRPTMILQLKANQGKGWSENDLKDALKQGIITPTDVHTFGHQLKNFWGLTTFFFGTESIIAESLSPLLERLSKHTITFEGAQLRDPTFVTKLGYAIDTRIFRWLDQCRTLKSRTQVNDSLLHFETLFDQVLTDSFIQNLPTTFQQFTPTPNQSNNQQSDTPQPDNHRAKRHRGLQHDNQHKERIINSKQIPEWIVSPTDYRNKIMGKNLEARPKIQQRPMCQRFHSKGYCFSDCVNKITHIPSEDIEPTTQRLYRKYVDKCQQG